MGLGPLGIPTGEHGPAVSAVKRLMSVNADNLSAAVLYALETTRAIAVCPFHCDVIIRVGDDAAETHLLCAREGSSKAMARRGREKPFGKNLDANSAKPLTVTVLTAPVWATRSYEGLRLPNASREPPY
jgi:hypothetical protein